MMIISSELAFSPQEYQSRVNAVRGAMATANLDIVLLHSLPSICYLTGFQTVATRSYNCFALTADGSHEIITERDEQYNVKQSSWVKNISTYARWIDPVQVTMDVIKRFTKNSRARIGIESASRYLTPLQYSQLELGLRPAEIVDASAIVPRLMLLKSPTEIKYIKNAARITVAGMKAAIDAVAVGKTDNYIASVASQTLIAEGSEYMSSDPIVCVGQNSSIPHGHYANRKVGRGDTVLLEMSACVRRYSAPLMRGVSLGKPNIEVAKMAETCKLALNSVIGRMRPGSLFKDAASTGKKVIERAGSSLVFHGTYAYSIGLGFPGTSWADAPVEVRDDENGVFEEGMVFHLPMSLRDPGRTGVAYSETVVITSDGCEVLTEMEQEFSIK